MVTLCWHKPDPRLRAVPTRGTARCHQSPDSLLLLQLSWGSEDDMQTFFKLLQGKVWQIGLNC